MQEPPEKCWCGEDHNGYMKHRRRGQQPCAASKSAWAAYYRNRRRTAT